MWKTLLLVVPLLLSGPLGQDDDQEKAPPKKRQMDERVWVEGQMVCIGCTLAKEHGVDAQCTLHARHALGFQDAEGRLWTLVDNSRGHPVLTNQKLRDKPIRVHGWQYAKHQYLELWNYAQKSGDEWQGWDWCKICGYEQGDNQGKDLCATCDDS